MTAAKKIIVVAGARPNFMKVAPILNILKKSASLKPYFVHTGQHYDYHMSEVFFQDLKIPSPTVHLNVGSGAHGEQTGRIMAVFEPVVAREKPDAVLVVGDVNSSLACALVAAKMNVKVAHVESGLRSFDREMPEEVNRIVTDRISDWLFVSEPSGLANLKNEGEDPKKAFHVGNVMIDSLIASMPDVKKSGILKQLDLKPGGYALVTLHRPSNVDTKESLRRMCRILKIVASKIQVVYPVHPRTQKMIHQAGFGPNFEKIKNLRMIKPQGYIDFVRLVKDSKMVLTDSGGIQEETTYLRVPCLTLRSTTERPITISEGTNRLVGFDEKQIIESVETIMKGRWTKGRIPKFWDGQAAKRIIKIIQKAL